MDIWLIGFVSAAFISAAGITFAVGRLVTSRSRLRRRLPAGSSVSDALTLTPVDNLGALVAEPFTGGVLGISQKVSKEWTLKLMRAGYFSPNAVRFYVLARICAVVIVPSLVLLTCTLLLRDLSSLTFALAAAAAVGVGILGPDAYLARRQAWQIIEYRLNFPDLLDLLTVCVTAGLTVEASFERIRDRLSKRSRALGHNIQLMGGRDACGKKLRRCAQRIRGPVRPGRSGVLRRCLAALCGAWRRRRYNSTRIQ
jgi:tight adherence protein C